MKKRTFVCLFFVFLLSIFLLNKPIIVYADNDSQDLFECVNGSFGIKNIDDLILFEKISNCGFQYFNVDNDQIVEIDDINGLTQNVDYYICSDYLQGSFVLTNDIVLNDGLFEFDTENNILFYTSNAFSRKFVVDTVNDLYSTYSLMEWTPINNFCGSFDGNGHVINGLYITENGYYSGLFGHIESAHISNLKIDNTFIKSGSRTGALVGSFINSDEGINNISIENSTIYGLDLVGGIAGYGLNSGINTCYVANSNVISANGKCGGIIGKIANHFSVSSCYTSVKIYSREAGALVGYMSENDMVSNLYYNIDLESFSAVGNVEDSEDVKGLHEESFYNGYLASLLGNSWGQILDNESFPRFCDTLNKNVFKITFNGLNFIEEIYFKNSGDFIELPRKVGYVYTFSSEGNEITEGFYVLQNLDIIVNVERINITVLPSPLIVGEYHKQIATIDLKDYIANLDDVGGISTYSVKTSERFPIGLILNLSNGEISGTPLEANGIVKEVIFSVLAKNGAAANITIRLLINKARVTLKADDIESVYGDELKNLTYSYVGEIYGEDIMPTLSVGNIENSGTYTIEIDANNSNYDITLVNGMYTIKKAQLSFSRPIYSVIKENGEVEINFGLDNKFKIEYANVYNGEYREENVKYNNHLGNFKVYYKITHQNYEDYYGSLIISLEEKYTSRELVWTIILTVIICAILAFIIVWFAVLKKDLGELWKAIKRISKMIANGFVWLWNKIVKFFKMLLRSPSEKK